MVPQAGGGGGMSRAAKKRAKKKQKQQSTSSIPKHNHDANEVENVVVVPKKQLFDDNDNDNDHDQPLRKISTKKKSKKRKSKMKDSVEEEEEDRNKSTTKKKTKKSSHKKMKELLVHNDEDESDRDRDNVEMEMDGQMDSDDNHENDNVSPTRAKGELQKENDSHDDNDDDDDDDDDDIDQVVQDMVSMLSPSTILMLKNNNAADAAADAAADPHDATILNMAKEQLSGIDLCQDVLPDMSSKIRATCLLNSLLSPAQLTSEEFYKSYWEKQPLVIPASSSNEQAEQGTITHRHLHGFLSLRSIQTLLDKEPMCYGRDLNVTRYEDTTGDGTKRRITLDLVKDNDTNHNDGGDGGDDDDDNFVLCDSKDVWSNYHDMGATIRLLCPHKHVDSVHALLSTLELEFGCMVGANAYLTPPGESQGFAPHYDDIEAFVLQLEGSKHWKVYAPLSKGETLPRQSSTDYTEEQLKDVEPTVDVVLKPGDILYMPRGWIHQAMTLPSSSSPPKQQEEGHSLHLTVSAMQNWAWSDLLELLLPEALEATCQSTTSTSLRQGLPRNFLDYMGAIHETTSSNEDLPEGLKQAAEAHGDEEDEEDKEERYAKQRKLQQQEQFREEAKKRIMRVCKEAMSMIDAGCDQIGKRFLSDRLPPALFTKNELSFTSESKDNAAALATGGKVWPNTMCRLVRPGIARLALEDNKAVLYHCVDNSRVYHGNPLSPMEFELDDAPALEMLLTTVEPHWIAVQDLIHDDIEDKMDIAQSLYDEGILAIVQMETPDRSVQTG